MRRSSNRQNEIHITIAIDHVHEALRVMADAARSTPASPAVDSKAVVHQYPGRFHRNPWLQAGDKINRPEGKAGNAMPWFRPLRTPSPDVLTADD
jgi:hypothetical protein